MSEEECVGNGIYLKISEEDFVKLLEERIKKYEKMAKLEIRDRDVLDDFKRLYHEYKILKEAGFVLEFYVSSDDSLLFLVYTPEEKEIMEKKRNRDLIYL